ncbi:MAG: GGDEF domain-containing protein [Spirochaetes bacterium]|nr:GGDEF domain-containing protein [Spirochaetota bacterium]
MDENFYKNLLDNINDGIYYVDKERKVTFWNKSAEKITGFAQEDVIGRKCSDNILRHIDKDGNELCITGCPLHATLMDSKKRENLVYLHHKSGHRLPVLVKVSPIYNDKKEIIGAIEIFTDKSTDNQALKELETLKKEVYTDSVTGIGNRKYAEIVLANHYNSAASSEASLGLLFIDIDNFKSINDTYGHDVGDKILAMVSSTIKGILRNFDTVARWGGEEFIVIIPDTSKDILVTVSERIRLFVEKSWLTENNKKISVTISVGATLFNKRDTMKELVNRADELMYKSKKNGKNKVSFG